MDPATTVSTATSLIKILELLGPWGVLGFIFATNMAIPLVILILWYVNARRYDVLVRKYQDDMDKSLERYGEALNRVTQYYNDNVELVQDWKKLADDLHSTVVLNTRTMQSLCDRIDHNHFCPQVRDKAGSQ